MVHPAGAAIVQLLKSDAFKQALATLDPETRAELLKYLQGVHRETLQVSSPPSHSPRPWHMQLHPPTPTSAYARTFPLTLACSPRVALQSEVEAAAARAAEGGVLSDDDVVLLERYNPGALEAARAAAGGAGAGAGADGEGDGKGEGGDGGADAGTSTSEDFVDKDNPAPFGFAHRRVQVSACVGGVVEHGVSRTREHVWLTSATSAATAAIVSTRLPALDWLAPVPTWWWLVEWPQRRGIEQ